MKKTLPLNFFVPFSLNKAQFSGDVLKQKEPLALRSGALFLSIIGGIFLLSNVALAASNPSHPAASSLAPSSGSSKKLAKTREERQKETLQKFEKALSQSKSEKETQILWEKAERARQATLNNAPRLLLKEAQEKEKKGDVQSIESLLSTALALQPDNSLLRRLRASTRIKGNDPMGAIQDLGVALLTDQDDPIAWLLLAKAQENLHRPSHALQAFKEAERRVPFLPEKEKLQQHFEQQAYGQED
ncbi:hypothetical protein GT348_07515 [Aristophania vespae]|uniref:Tetratricopeptide repeat protein n=1 Tax=Aristophania vespae TaxID=2697033 RepID=A0A6P1NHU9_9PROT|nr:hypothetical protein [Aristophania vespae]QHI96104.1 hypothetical protein GT348_07515 [Aristophania vespae]UMM63874.1 hypothetical protein DM15PD_08520 [Aristophania vespae]